MQASRPHCQVLQTICTCSASFKLTIPAAEVQGAGVECAPKESRATEAFIGNCPTITVKIEGVELFGLLDTGSQVTLMQQSLFKQHFPQINCDRAPVFFKLRAANGLELPCMSYAVLDMEVEGVTIPGRGVVIAKDEHCTHPLVIGMNVVTSCWDTLFKQSESGLPPQKLQSHQAWRDAFATCRCIEATMTEDGLLGYVRPTSRRIIKVPPKSELLVWGRTRKGPGGKDYCALMEALPENSSLGVARTLTMVRDGRVPVRICNPHFYCLTIG